MSDQGNPLFPVLTDEELSPEAAEVFEDIRRTRGVEYVNNIWRVLANDPVQLKSTWDEVKSVVSDGALDVATKQLIYIAVSVAHGCEYCVRSHTAAARGLGVTDDQLKELFQVIGIAAKTNRLAAGLQVPVDEIFK